MATHSVKVILPELDISRADAVFPVKVDGSAFGRLRISNGALVWVPANHIYGYRLGWAEFDRLARQHGANGHK